MLLFLVLSPLFPARRAHLKRPLGDQHQFHPDDVGARFCRIASSRLDKYFLGQIMETAIGYRYASS